MPLPHVHQTAGAAGQASQAGQAGKKSSAPAWLLGAGLLLGALGLLGLILGGVQTFRSSNVSGLLNAQPITVPGTAQMDLQAQRYVVFQDQSSYAVISPSDIAVAGMSGPVPVSAMDYTEEISDERGDFIGIATFDVQQAGPHQVQVMSSEQTEVVVAPSLVGAGKKAGGWIGLTIASGLLVALGVGLLLLALVLRLVGKKPAPVGAGGPGGPGGAGGPGGYGPAGGVGAPGAAGPYGAAGAPGAAGSPGAGVHHATGGVAGTGQAGAATGASSPYGGAMPGTGVQPSSAAGAAPGSPPAHEHGGGTHHGVGAVAAGAAGALAGKLHHRSGDQQGSENHPHAAPAGASDETDANAFDASGDGAGASPVDSASADGAAAKLGAEDGKAKKAEAGDSSDAPRKSDEAAITRWESEGGDGIAHGEATTTEAAASADAEDAAEDESTRVMESDDDGNSDPTSGSHHHVPGVAAGAAAAGAHATHHAAAPGAGGLPEAGWYPDPENQSQWRWWDGNQWADPLEQSRPQTLVGSTPPVAAAEPPPNGGDAGSGGHNPQGSTPPGSTQPSQWTIPSPHDAQPQRGVGAQQHDPARQPHHGVGGQSQPGAAQQPSQVGAQQPHAAGQAQAATPGSSGSVPPGWYVDPNDSRQWRYWDGTTWTSHTS